MEITDLGHVFFRGIIAFVFLLLLARLMGKKHMSQITYFEYIVGITIGSIAAELTFSPHIRLSNFILGLIIWSALPIIITKVDLKSYHFRILNEGRPQMLITQLSHRRMTKTLNQ